jgi:hypothetical protein
MTMGSGIILPSPNLQAMATTSCNDVNDALVSCGCTVTGGGEVIAVLPVLADYSDTSKPQTCQCVVRGSQNTPFYVTAICLIVP